jgi:hypothetical protein
MSKSPVSLTQTLTVTVLATVLLGAALAVTAGS